VDSAARIDVSKNTILHKTAHGELVETKNWLKEGPLVIGVTSGASTPDRAIEEVLDRIFKIKVGRPRMRSHTDTWRSCRDGDGFVVMKIEGSHPGIMLLVLGKMAANKQNLFIFAGPVLYRN